MGPSIPQNTDIISRTGIAAGYWERFDPFSFMAEDFMKKGAFDYHPHRGIETVTYILTAIKTHGQPWRKGP